MKSVAQSFAVGSGGPNLNSGQFFSRAFLCPSVRPASAPSAEDTVKGSATDCGGSAARWDCSACEESEVAPGVRPAPRGPAQQRLPSALRHTSHTGLRQLHRGDATYFFCPHLESVNVSVPGLSVCRPFRGFFIQPFTNTWPHTPDAGCWGYDGVTASTLERLPPMAVVPRVRFGQ